MSAKVVPRLPGERVRFICLAWEPQNKIYPSPPPHTPFDSPAPAPLTHSSGSSDGEGSGFFLSLFLELLVSRCVLPFCGPILICGLGLSSSDVFPPSEQKRYGAGHLGPLPGDTLLLGTARSLAEVFFLIDLPS